MYVCVYVYIYKSYACLWVSPLWLIKNTVHDQVTIIKELKTCIVN